MARMPPPPKGKRNGSGKRNGNGDQPFGGKKAPPFNHRKPPRRGKS